MPIEVIYCPMCSNKLRVPEHLMGMPVECPKCHANFTAPPPPPPQTGGPDAPMVSPRPRSPEEVVRERIPESERRPYGEFDRPPDDFDDQGYRDIWQRSLPPGHVKILAPGIALLAVGVIITLLNALDLVILIAQPQMFKQQMQMMMGQAPNEGLMVLAYAMRVISIVMAFVQMIAGFCMMRSRGYMFAIIGSLASLVNPNCCCLLSIPVGIWALVMLFQSDVKASFER